MRRFFILLVFAVFLLAACTDYQVPVTGDVVADENNTIVSEVVDEVVEQPVEELPVENKSLEVPQSALKGAMNEEYRAAVEESYKKIGMVDSGEFIRKHFMDLKKLNTIDSPLGPKTVSMMYSGRGHTTFLYNKDLDITLGACYGVTYKFSKKNCQSPYYD